MTTRYHEFLQAEFEINASYSPRGDVQPSRRVRRGENVRDLNVRLFDMARANTVAAFDFAREVAEANGPSDFPN